MIIIKGSDNMKKMILSYDIRENAYDEKEIWDALYDMPHLTIVDKPVLSTLLLKSEDELMYIKIAQMLNAKFRDLSFVISRVGVRKDKEGNLVNCYLNSPNMESQKQIRDYLESKKQAVKK